MIQRRTNGGAGLDPPTPSVAAANQNGNGHSSSATAGNGVVRKRRVRRSDNNTSRNKRHSSSRWIKRLSRVFTNGDSDCVVTLIQITGVIIIIGCSITLMLHFFGTGEIMIGDDDVTINTWQNSFLVRMNRWFLGRNILRHELHHDHQNSGRQNSNSNSNRRKKKDGSYFPDLTPSSIYTVPGSMTHIGDKSDQYAQLRKEYDAMDLPKVEQRYKFETMPMETDVGSNGKHPDHLPLPYDIHDCPEYPPENYPYAWNLLQILDHWPPDKPKIPEDLTIFQGICVFDFEKDYQKALNYRKEELPFVVSNDPAVQDTAKRWMAQGFMDRLMGDVKHRAEFSESNHFMYWNAGAQMRKQKVPRGRAHAAGGNVFPGDGHPNGRGVDKDIADWQQPTTMMRMTYQDWLSHANLTEGESVGPHDPHYYYRLIGCGEQSPIGNCDKGSSEYLFDELTFFQPKENMYMVDPNEQKGIHCRFGMNGVIAENHFDMSRNAIAVMGGERRYILSHPKQCPLLSLLPKGHPSARHSAVDWSDPDLETYPEFAQAEGNEIVLQAGDVLYLPTNWFHYIISLNLNWQCNSRSGITPTYFKPMRQCGF